MAGVGLAPGDMGRLPGTFISLSRLSCDRQAPALAEEGPSASLGSSGQVPTLWVLAQVWMGDAVGAWPGVDGGAATFLEAGSQPPDGGSFTFCLWPWTFHSHGIVSHRWPFVPGFFLSL